MSETTQTPPPAEPEYVPRNVLSSEDNEDATKPLQQPEEAPQEAAGDKPEADPAEEERRRRDRREAQRIGYLTKQRYAEKARADALEQRLRQLENPADPNGAQRPLTQEQYQQHVRQAAAQLAEQEKHNERFKSWDEQGREAYGREKFLEASRTVAELASDEQRRNLVEVVMDTEGGHRAIMEMSENAEEAERIPALPPHRMAIAVAKLAAASAPAAPAPRPVSNAPPPIRPPTAGRARGEPDPERGDMPSFERWSAKQNWRR